MRTVMVIRVRIRHTCPKLLLRRMVPEAVMSMEATRVASNWVDATPHTHADSCV